MLPLTDKSAIILLKLWLVQDYESNISFKPACYLSSFFFQAPCCKDVSDSDFQGVNLNISYSTKCIPDCYSDNSLTLLYQWQCGAAIHLMNRTGGVIQTPRYL